MVAAIYARVSTNTGKQHTENQLPELRDFAKRQGWDSVEYVEHASAKRGAKRPILTQLLADAKEGKIQVVLVQRIDRFGRSLVDFLANVQKLNDAGVRFIATAQAIDTDKHSAVGTLTMQILAVVAYGKTRHSKSGEDKPPGRPKHIFHRGRAAEMRAAGVSDRKIAVALGVPRSTIRLALQAVLFAIAFYLARFALRVTAT
jgi:putative DNA-invertase from lambdoid prophage Rac